MPHSHKSNRSLAKRIKISSTGKLSKRKARQNHFNAKDSGTTGLHKHGSKPVAKEYTKQFQALLPERDIAS